ncbi:MAG: Sec-independent protein translocase subunit TatA [Gammaproteobacteria bacterium]|nr:Sec-independent protein translocase subunit TatA [Gammaproteobacteria bacterium]
MSFGIWELLIVLVIVVFIFGTKRVRNLGGDLGSAIKSFRSALKDGDAEQVEDDSDAAGNVIEGESVRRPDHENSKS